MERMPGFGTAPEDFKTKAIKKSLLHDVRQTVLANKLQCKPIEGHDIPLTVLDRKESLNSMVKMEAASKPVLYEVETIEQLANEISSNEKIF